MISYIDYNYYANKLDFALNNLYPKISTEGTSTGIDSLEQWSMLWSEYAGFDSPYKLHEILSRYEHESGRKTPDVIKQWRDGTLRRDSQINDWISTYLLLEGYSNR